MLNIRKVSRVIVIGSLVFISSLQAMDDQSDSSLEMSRKSSAPAKIVVDTQSAIPKISSVKLARLKSLQAINPHTFKSPEFEKLKQAEIERKQYEDQLLQQAEFNNKKYESHQLDPALAERKLIEQALVERNKPVIDSMIEPGDVSDEALRLEVALRKQQEEELEQFLQSEVCIEIDHDFNPLFLSELVEPAVEKELEKFLEAPVPAVYESPRPITGDSFSALKDLLQDTHAQQESADLVAVRELAEIWLGKIHSTDNLVNNQLLRDPEVEPSPFKPNDQLFSAIIRGDLSLVQIALQSGANLGMSDVHGDTPLHCALNPDIVMTVDERLGILRLLIESGAKVSELNNKGRTAVHQAALSMLPEAAQFFEYLYEQSIFAELIDFEGKLPLHVAVERGRTDLVKLLAKKSSFINQTDFNNRTPLQVAFQSQLLSKVKKVIVSDLILAGANPDVCDEEKTPLLFNVIKSVDLVGLEVLLAHGADVKKTDIRNRTAVQFAQEKVEKSENPKAAQVLHVVKEYYEGKRVPQALKQQASAVQITGVNHVSILVPESLQGKIDIAQFNEQIRTMLTTPGADGKMLLQIALEKAYITGSQAAQEKVVLADKN